MDSAGMSEVEQVGGVAPTLDSDRSGRSEGSMFATSPAASVPIAVTVTAAAGMSASELAALETAINLPAWNRQAKSGPAVNEVSVPSGNAPLDEATMERLNRCMKRTGVEFHDPRLLLLALTHASCAGNSGESNERLEFLGDSLLGFVASELLFTQYRDKQEGELTRMKALMVSSKWCSRFCSELGLREYMQLGKGIAHDGVSEKVQGNLFEAFVGAVFADSGYESARKLLRRLLDKFLPEIVIEADWDNPKSDLQHIAQRDFNASPVYDIVASSGPDHQKVFEIRVRIGTLVFPPATGSSKRAAEKQAARNALNELNARPRS